MLVDRHHDALIGYLYRMCGGKRPLAEDLAQETFLRVLRSIDQYDHLRPFKPWLYAIATNLVRSHYARADTRRSVTMSNPVAKDATTNPPIEDMVTDSEDVQQAVQALMTLPDHFREAIVLRYLQELSLAEIAEVLDIPVGTVKSRLSNGLRKLREIVEQR